MQWSESPIVLSAAGRSRWIATLEGVTITGSVNDGHHGGIATTGDFGDEPTALLQYRRLVTSDPEPACRTERNVASRRHSPRRRTSPRSRASSTA